MNTELIQPKAQGQSSLTQIDPNDGNYYRFSFGFEEEKAIELTKDFIKIAKEKGLTVRQAQELFLVCADYVLESKFQ